MLFFSILKADDRSDTLVHHLNVWRGTALYSITSAEKSIHIYKQISAVSFKPTNLSVHSIHNADYWSEDWTQSNTLPRNKENYNTKMHLRHPYELSISRWHKCHTQQKKSRETLIGVQRSSRGVNGVLTLDDKSTVTYFMIKSFRQQGIGFISLATTMKDCHLMRAQRTQYMYRIPVSKDHACPLTHPPLIFAKRKSQTSQMLNVISHTHCSRHFRSRNKPS